MRKIVLKFLLLCVFVFSLLFASKTYATSIGFKRFIGGKVIGIEAEAVDSTTLNCNILPTAKTIQVLLTDGTSMGFYISPTVKSLNRREPRVGGYIIAEQSAFTPIKITCTNKETKQPVTPVELPKILRYGAS